MRRYYFNVRSGSDFTEDEEGRELPDAGVARAEAIHGARSLIAADVLDGQLDLEGCVEVADGDGAVLFTIDFAHAVEIRLRPPLRSA
jgi:hypothetical protein